MPTDLSADSMDTQRQLDAARAAEKAKEAEQKAPDPSTDRALLGVETARQARVETAKELSPTTNAPSPAADKVPTAAPPERAATPTPHPTLKPEELGFFASLGAGLKSMGTWVSDNVKAAFDWIRKQLGIEKKEDEETSFNTAAQTVDKAFQGAKEVAGQLTIRTWEELKLIANPAARVVQAALFAYATKMDCFTKDGNHCSGWCDSVFNKAGLNLYDDSKRIYVGDYKGWRSRGSLAGLALQPGDSILYFNGNNADGRGGPADPNDDSRGHHQDIVLSAQGPDAQGNYKVTTVGQTKAEGSTGTRKIRTLTVASNRIKVVVRPTA